MTQGARGGGGGVGRGGAMRSHFEGRGLNLMPVEFDREHVIAGLFSGVFQFVRVSFRLFNFALLDDSC